MKGRGHPSEKGHMQGWASLKQCVGGLRAGRWDRKPGGGAGVARHKSVRRTVASPTRGILNATVSLNQVLAVLAKKKQNTTTTNPVCSI